MKTFFMRLDDSDYKKLLEAAYKKIKADGTRTRLTNPTRGDLRKECLVVFQARPNKKDEHILIAFYGTPGEKESLLELMQRCESEKFRTLANYMRGNTASTDNINMELLAWLIDFKHRPNRWDNQVTLSDEEKEILGLTEPSESGTIADPLDEAIPTDQEPVPRASKRMELKQSVKDETAMNGDIEPGNKQAKPLRQPWPKIVKRAAVVLGIGAVVSGGMYAIKSVDQKECMYWTGDHYEKVDCGEQSKGRRIIQLDNESIGLQKIMMEDTITEQSVGKIYYIQDKKDVQYFTQDGNYPGDPNRGLRKLTRLIYEKDSANRLAAKLTKP